ncbi:TfoX/Sxy family protein [Microbaculum marinisediminis]|uniref:TfoX/Sxy family protein n=1 Tax=Microbaculum marinisediminis TaxID=2931392 RepID=A0AAW5R5Q6_9HYPH|nr:TfoX/Sxy family protein [Microbaculum sp. A6E488]MCT8974442.1 TfoX/Sxy family protein [Microbaculum sp. A6E488]
MAITSEYSDFVTELFAGFGPVRLRGMFGGTGIFHDDVMIGLIADGTIFLRTDAALAADMAAEGSTPFVYSSTSKTVEMPYWRLPERLIDEPDDLAAWARRAYQAAAQARKPKKKRSKKAV